MAWRGAVALVLALCIGIGWTVSLLWVITHPTEAGDRAPVALYALGGTLLGGVLSWLGTGPRRGDHDD